MLPMPAETLTCPMCGAPVADLNSPQCEHCGARLATVACPSCFGLIFQGAKFCSHCGAKVDRTEVDSTTTRQCPRCNLNLNAVLVGNTSLRECPHCEGIWVDADLLQQICADREKQSAVLGLPFIIEPTEVENIEEHIHYLRCPICSQFMNRVNFAHCSGVIVDVCMPHGTWFDKDELRRIIEFIRAGGLDQARAREIEELKHERQELESAQTIGPMGDLNYTEPAPMAKYDLIGAGISAAASMLKLWLK
jgi:Zn-finger nucleic acid-binding protein